MLPPSLCDYRRGSYDQGFLGRAGMAHQSGGVIRRMRGSATHCIRPARMRNAKQSRPPDPLSEPVHSLFSDWKDTHYYVSAYFLYILFIGEVRLQSFPQLWPIFDA